MDKNIITESAQEDLDYYNLDHRMGRDSGLAAGLLANNSLFTEMKKDNWRWEDWTSPVTKTTFYRENGKLHKEEEQYNVEAIRQWCLRYRKMSEEGVPDNNPLAVSASITRGDDKPSYRWINLPKVLARKISNEYFGGMDWEILKKDKTLRAQFYRVVETEYNDFVCHPHGKLPIPIQVPYPSKVGETKFFKGH